MSIIITGANRGLGKKLAEIIKSSSKANSHIVITGRDEQSIKQVAEENKLDYAILDISDDDSIKNFPSQLQQKGISSISVLVNNAAILNSGWEENNFQKTLKTNTFGTLSLIDAVLPLLSNGSRVVNVSSRLGQLSNISQNYQKLVTDSKTLEDFKNITFDPSDVDMQKAYAPTYSLSKAILNRATQILAASDPFTTKNISIACVCPGWCKTDMGGPSAHRTDEQGARSILSLIERPELPTSKFFADEGEQPW